MVGILAWYPTSIPNRDSDSNSCCRFHDLIVTAHNLNYFPRPGGSPHSAIMDHILLSSTTAKNPKHKNAINIKKTIRTSIPTTTTTMGARTAKAIPITAYIETAGGFHLFTVQ